MKRSAPTPKYSDSIDYLLVAIIHLGVHTYWWGRSATSMAAELTLDRERLLRVFRGFPGIFRESTSTTNDGEPYFALQARYAQFKSDTGEEPKPNSASDIPPLDTEKLRLLIDFVQTMTEHEKTDRRGRITGFIAVSAAIASAAAAMFSAYIANDAKTARSQGQQQPAVATSGRTFSPSTEAATKSHSPKPTIAPSKNQNSDSSAVAPSQ
jgi:hypothetical protein